MERNQFVQDCIDKVKAANIDDLYLSSIGFDTSKKKGICPIHRGADNKNGFSFTDKKGYRQYSCWTNGCIGQGVDIIHLCKVKQELSNEYEAAKFLAKMFNIELPKVKYSKEEKKKYYASSKLKEFQEEKKNHLEQLKKEAIKNKDLEKAFAIESIIDNLDIKHTEYINYSKYTPTKVYEIDRYISENIEGLEMAINEASNGKKILVLAPTGSGKTDTTIKNNRNINSCFISPNASNVEQIVNNQEYNIPGAFADIGAEDTFTKEGMKGFTWDKFASLKDVELSDSIAIVDEIHQTFNDMYRSDKIKGLYSNLDKCKGRIDITATPNKLDLEIYDVIIEYKQKEQTKYNVKLYNNINDDKIIEIINKSSKFALLENNTKNLQYYQMATNKKTDIVTRSFVDNSLSNTYDLIMRNSSIGDYQGIFNSSIIVAGVNIYDKDITDIVIIGEKDISTIKQYVARFRDLKEVNIHIFNNYKDHSNTYGLEYMINEEIKDTQNTIESINGYNRKKFIQQGTDIQFMKLEQNNNFYYDESTKEYKIDIPGIRHFYYSNYYRKSDIISFKGLLKEYFTDISIVDINEDKSADKKEFKQELKLEENNIIDKFENYLDLLVGANEIIKNKLSPKLQKYLINNNLREEKILEQLKENGIVELLKVGKISSKINLYTKYVVENNFTYEFAWFLCNLGNRKRGKIFNQLNSIVYREVLNEYPQLIDNNLIENRVYNLITNDFKPGISYTNEHLESFIEVLQIVIPGVKISINKIGEIINNTYHVEENRHKTTMLHQLDYYFYRNISPNPCNGKQIKINTIKDFKKINDIVIENDLSSISQKSLETIAKKRFQKIVESDEAKAILDINKIFAS